MESEVSLLCSQGTATGPCTVIDESRSHPPTLCLRLIISSGLLSSGFPTKIFYAFRISPMRATRPVHVPRTSTLKMETAQIP